MDAIVYIRTEIGKALSALEKIKKIPGVRTAFATTGRFDIVACIEVFDLKALGESVVGKIQSIDGVKSTETSMVVA